MKMNSDNKTYWTQERVRQKQMADQQKQALVNKQSKGRVEAVKSEIVQVLDSSLNLRTLEENLVGHFTQRSDSSLSSASKAFDLTEEQKLKVEQARELLKSTKENYFQQMDSYRQGLVQKTGIKEQPSHWDNSVKGIVSTEKYQYQPEGVQGFISSVEEIVSYKEEIPVKDIIPIFVDPMIFPKSTYVRTFIGGVPSGCFERNWLIVRTFDQFIETIENLFGKFDTPTRIPLALSLPFDLDVKKEFIVKPTSTREWQEEKSEPYEEDVYFDSKGNQIGGLKFYQGRRSAVKSVPVKKLIAKKSSEKTGLDITNWLIENNYIPEAVNVHDREYFLNYHNEISERFSELFQRENLRDKVNCVDYV